MRTRTITILVGLVGLALLAASCGAETEAPPAVAPAEPQRVTLDWVEPYPTTGPRLVFTTTSLEVTRDGWEARVSIENRTDITWELATDPVAVQQGFGLMLFETGELEELERRTRDGDMPGIRAAQEFTPPLAAVLDPGQSWEGRISAPGTLAAGRYARVVFGTLTAVGDPPEGLGARIVWITDHAYRLE